GARRRRGRPGGAARRRRRPAAPPPAREPAPGGRRAAGDGRHAAGRRAGGVVADDRRAPPHPAAVDAPVLRRDRRAPVRLAAHGEDPGHLRLPQARRLVAQRGGRPGAGAGAARAVAGPVPVRGFHPVRTMRPRRPGRPMVAMSGDARPRMQLRDPEGDRRRRLRQLAEPGTCVAPTPTGAARWGESSLLDARTAALVCLATLVALRGGPASYRRGVADALAVGAGVDDVVATLEVVAGTVGLARVVAAAPDLARA